MNKITDGITDGIDVRKQRGLEIAALARIERRDGYYIVPSQFNPKATKYRVKAGENPSCSCADHETRRCKCKHIYAVEYAIRRESNGDGTTTVTESVKLTKDRQTYPQDWKNYNLAQQNEKRHFQSLLRDLCRTIVEPQQKKRGRGQPKIALADAIFCAVFKVYSTVSARRFTSDLCDAQAKGYISRVPHFNSVLNCLGDSAMYSVLSDLIEKSSLPLRSIESQFAVDSTGFTACRFVRWYDVKYNRFTSMQQWVKAHLCCGVKTNVVTAVEIHERDANDGPILPALIKTTAKNFAMKEVCADKGYSGRDCHNAIGAIGATPYIAFKANATGDVGGLFWMSPFLLRLGWDFPPRPPTSPQTIRKVRPYSPCTRIPEPAHLL